MKSRVQSRFLLYLTTSQQREQTGTTQNVTNEYQGDMVNKGGKNIHFPVEHRSKNFARTGNGVGDFSRNSQFFAFFLEAVLRLAFASLMPLSFDRPGTLVLGRDSVCQRA